jgi:hypothetical protein
MAHPVAGIDGVGGGDPGAGGVRDPGDRGRAQLEAGEQAAQPLGGGRHLGGVEGVGGGQPAAGDPLGRQARGQGLHGLDRAGGDAEVRSVDRGHGEAVRQKLGQPVLGHRDGEHGAGGEGFQEAGARRDDPQAVLEGEDPRQAGRRVLAQAVAQGRGGAHAPGLPEPDQGHLDQEDRRLIQGGVPGVAGAAEHPPEIHLVAGGSRWRRE